MVLSSPRSTLYGVPSSLLVKFQLPWKQLSSEKADEIAEMIRSGGVNTPLQVNLIGNRLSDEGTAIITKHLPRTVEDLNLSCNSLSAKGAASISDFLRKSPSIKDLCLFGNSIGDDGAIAISKALKHNSSLRMLNLAYNNISEDGAIALANSLKGNHSLVTLDLTGNKIGDEGAWALAGLNTVKELCLSRNQVGDLGAIQFANKLSNSNSGFTTLHLADNEITSTGGRALAMALSRNTNLRTLDLRLNEMIGEKCLHSFAEAMEGNVTLESLQLKVSQFHPIQKQLNHSMRLNKAGRGLVRRLETGVIPYAFSAAKDPTVLFCLLGDTPHAWTSHLRHHGERRRCHDSAGASSEGTAR